MKPLPIVERPITDWLPITMKEVEKRGWEELDVVLISGDAYVDHPAFGTAVIGRILESEGLRIAIVAQPSWKENPKAKRDQARRVLHTERPYSPNQWITSQGTLPA